MCVYNFEKTSERGERIDLDSKNIDLLISKQIIPFHFHASHQPTYIFCIIWNHHNKNNDDKYVLQQYKYKLSLQ